MCFRMRILYPMAIFRWVFREAGNIALCCFFQLGVVRDWLSAWFLLLAAADWDS